MAKYGPKPRPVEERFWDHVDSGPSDDCWVWQGAKQAAGYGYLTLTRTPRTWVKAHRLSWEIHNGPIPDGLSVCHHCDNPPCVNPDHLFLGTTADNNADRHSKGRSRGGTIGNKRDVRGTANPNVVLTEVEVRAIDAMLKADVSYGEIAKVFGVGQTTVWKIKARRSWAHLWDE